MVNLADSCNSMCYYLFESLNVSAAMFIPLQNETFINQPPLVKNLKLQPSLPEVEGNIIA